MVLANNPNSAVLDAALTVLLLLPLVLAVVLDGGFAFSGMWAKLKSTPEYAELRAARRWVVSMLDLHLYANVRKAPARAKDAQPLNTWAALTAALSAAPLAVT